MVDRARARADFAGIYVDREEGGGIAVLVTGSVDDAEADLRPLLPAGDFSLRVLPAKFTFAELEDAQHELMDQPDGLRFALDFEVIGASVDEAANRLVIAIPPGSPVTLDDAGAQLAEALGVDVQVKVEVRSTES